MRSILIIAVTALLFNSCQTEESEDSNTASPIVVDDGNYITDTVVYEVLQSSFKSTLSNSNILIVPTPLISDISSCGFKFTNNSELDSVSSFKFVTFNFSGDQDDSISISKQLNLYRDKLFNVDLLGGTCFTERLKERYESDTKNINWSLFYQDGFEAIYSFSVPVFNRERTKAVVTYSSVCGGLCGHGTTIFLELINGEWKEIESLPGWVS